MTLGGALFCTVPCAHAYRPFDGTDADVAGTGELELEAGPVGYRRSDSVPVWVVPAIIVNYGFKRDWELVLEGRHAYRPHPEVAEPRSQMTDSALSLKEVLREGCLQGRRGISVANEWSLLFADTGSGQHSGAELTTIFSLRWQPLTLHLNVYNEFSRQGHYVSWLGPILEGPFAWRVRPVLELVLAREFGSARLRQGFFGSALLGAIGRIREDLSLDLAVRVARSQDVREQELRAGFTWSFDTRFEP
jgi:hypothetical protein